jgi:predicted Co/Zn/Cd cation transporter (cation efflux family)
MNIALAGLIYGVVVVGMMLVARDGVVGLLSQLATALRRRFAEKSAASDRSAKTDDRPDGRQFQT